MAKKSVKDLTTIFNFDNASYAHFCSDAGVDSKISYGELKTNIFSGYINQPVRTTDSPTFANATIGGRDINGKLLTMEQYLTQPVNPDSDVDFNSVNDVFIDLNGGANDVYIRNGLTDGAARGLMIDESKNLSDKADKTQLLNLPRIIYKQITDATVANTVTETSLLSGASSSRIIPANTLQAGDYIRFIAKGRMSTNNPTNTAQVKVLFNSTDLLQSSQLQVSASTLTNDLFMNDFDIKVVSVGVSGSVQLQGYTLIHPGTGITQPLMREGSGGIIAIDTTQDIVIDETYTWGQANANCTLTMSHVIIRKD